MNCVECRARLIAFVDGEIPPPGEAALREHLMSCAACRREEQALWKILTRVQADPVPDPSPRFWIETPRVVRKRLAHNQRRPLWSRWFTWTVWPQPAPILALGLILFLMLVVGRAQMEVRAPEPWEEAPPLAIELALSQDLDFLQRMELLEELDLLQYWSALRTLDGKHPT